jgi:hypothetical protein
MWGLHALLQSDGIRSGKRIMTAAQSEGDWPLPVKFEL